MNQTERREIYWAAYCVLESGEWGKGVFEGACKLLWLLIQPNNEFVGCVNHKFWTDIVATEFIEFMHQKPKHARMFWYPMDETGIIFRKEALLEAIKLTYL